ncbi:HD-GYP domain-containing protein [Thiolapillus sp.]
MLPTAALSVDAAPVPERANNFSAQLQSIYKSIHRQHPDISHIRVTLHLAGATAPKVFSTPDTSTRPLAQDGFPFPLAARKFQAADHTVPVNSPSCLNIPFAVDEQLWGNIFFTTSKTRDFSPEIIEQLHVYARVITQLITSEYHRKESLDSAISAILRLNKVSNSESPAHLKRVAHYSRLIAEKCAATHNLSGRWIEHLFLFAPVHDIGKIFMPEELLVKPGPLSPKEFALMKTHTLKGREIIDHVIDSFGYQEEAHYTGMLRNIITHHHEAIDGGGYPYGLKNQEIPLEARIVAAADVLDALLTKRSYKEAWSVDKSISHLRTLAGNRLDPAFVEILASSKEELIQIRNACGSG